MGFYWIGTNTFGCTIYTDIQWSCSGHSHEDNRLLSHAATVLKYLVLLAPHISDELKAVLDNVSLDKRRQRI